MRITKTVLLSTIEEYNNGLSEAGILLRFHYAPCYEWQSVDLVEVDDNGKRVDTCRLECVERGTSRECVNTLGKRYYRMLLQHERTNSSSSK